MSEPAAEHDAGGKTRLAMLPDTIGDAEISACGRYRHWLSRDWSTGQGGFALWIGMNPSVAEAGVDDPTIRREIGFTKAMGIGRYIKCNVMDYRATDPKQLLGVTPRSDRNIDCIVEHAAKAERIILAYGALPKPLRRYSDAVLMALRGHALYCMGRTKDGAPRHPLYLSGSAQPELWRAAP